jgi:hypothetical protein
MTGSSTGGRSSDVAGKSILNRGPELSHPQLSDSFIRTKRARCQLRIETGSLLEFGCWHLVRVLSWMVGSSDITRENRLGECQIATRCVNSEGGELSRFRSSGRLTGYTEITRLLARHKMFFGSSKSVRCGLPTNRNLLGYAKRQRSRHETSYQYLGVSIGSWLFIAQKLTNADLQWVFIHWHMLLARLLAHCRKNASPGCARPWISTGKGIFLQFKE